MQYSWCFSSLLYPPRLPHGPRAHAVGFVIAREFVPGRIELQRPAELAGDVGGVAGDVRLTGGVGVRPRLGPRLHAVEEVARVAPRRSALFRDDGFLRSQRFREDLDLPRIARLDP